MGNAALASVTQIGFTLVGFYIGGPFGAAVGASLGAFVAGELFGSDTEVSRGRLSNTRVASSEFGNPVPTIWGCCRLGSTAYFNSDLIEKIHKDRQSQGKGGGSTVTSKTFYYSIDIGYLLCLSPANFPLVSIPKVWMNGKLVVDTTNQKGPVTAAKYTGDGGGPFNTGSIRIRLGAEDQLPDPLYEEFGGVGTTPADRGYGTIILDDFPLEDFGNSPPQVNALCCTASTDVFPFDEMTGWTQNTRELLWRSDGRNFTPRAADRAPDIVNSDTREFTKSGVNLDSLIGTGNGEGGEELGFLDTDQFGRGLGWDLNLGSEIILYVFDMETYQVLGKMDNSGGRIVGSGANARFFGPNSERIFLTGNSAQDFAIYASPQIFPTATIADGFTFDGPLIDRIRDRTDWTDVGLPNTSEESVGVDGDGNLYTHHNSGGNTILVRWTLNGTIEAQFTDTGNPKLDDMPIGYDAVSNSMFWMTNNNEISRFEIDDETFSLLTLTSTNGGDDNLAAIRNGTYGGNIYIQTGTFGGGYKKVSIAEMREVKSYTDSDWAHSGTTGRGPTYDPYLHALIVSDTTNDPVIWLYLDRETNPGVTLESILNDEVLRAGFEGGASDRDASDHSATTVLGWLAGDQAKIVRESSAQATLYKFGQVETDHKITFPGRDRATSFALTDDDLGVVAGGAEPARKLNIERIDPSELPLVSELNFSDPNMGYQEGMQKYEFVPETVPGAGKVETRTFRVTMTNTEAKQRAFHNLRLKYGDQQRYRFTTFHINMQIDPGDTGTITSDGVNHLVMMEETQLGANYIYECTAVGFAIPTLAEADAIITSINTLDGSVAAQDADGYIEPTVAQLNPTNLRPIDAPFFTDAVDPGPGKISTQMVAQRTTPGAPWNGALITRSADNSTFNEFHNYPASLEGEIGVTSGTLGSQKQFTGFDDDNTIDVHFRADLVLASVTDEQMFEGRNHFMVGDEIIQAGTATDNGDGDWTLSHLLRGRRGTEWAAYEYGQISTTQGHASNELVFFLGDIADSNKASTKSIPLADKDVLNYYKGVTLGGVADIGTVRSLTNTGRSHQPYSPVDISGVKTGSDWTFSWVRRTRINGKWVSGSEVADIDTDEYEVDVLDESGVVVRTITQTASANGSVVSGLGATYDQLDIEADFSESPVVSGYPLYRVRIVVYLKNSESVGRGFAGVGELEAFPDPPTADASFTDVELILHCNSLNVRDRSQNRSSHGVLETGSAVTLRSGDFWTSLSGLPEFDEVAIAADHNSQYGTAHWRFSNVANSYIRLLRSDWASTNLFDFSGDFTVEFWARQDSEHNGVIVGVWDNVNTFRVWKIRFATNTNFPYGAIRVFASEDGTAVDLDLTINNTTDMGLNHYAFVRETNTISIYKAGARLAQDTTSLTAALFTGSTSDLVIGSEHNLTGQRMDGSLDSLRITSGTARYSGATYDVPPQGFAHN